MAPSRKAQASGAAILVALLALMIILYVLFLPPEDRAALLGEDTPATPGGGGGAASDILFASTVGMVYPQISPSFTHDFPTVSLRAVTAGTVLASRDSVTARNNVFEKDSPSVTFSADPRLVSNAVLSFTVRSRSEGNLIITHNGQEIFNQDVASRSVSPITLAIQEQANELSFSTSSVGFAFWRTNAYELGSVRVTADVKDLAGADGRASFTIGDEEYSRLATAQLSFVPICEEPGRISIFINDIEVYAGEPDCSSLNTLELAPAKLQPGENRVRFSTSDAQVILDRGRVSTTTKQQANRVFSFTLDASRVQGRQAVLRVRFADAAQKRGTIVVNGNTVPFTAQDTFEAQITPYVRPGQNAVQFVASDSGFEVVSFDVLVR